MTSTRDYLDSIRQSLDRIADSDDLDLAPGGKFRSALESLDAQAETLARAWGDLVKKDGKPKYDGINHLPAIVWHLRNGEDNAGLKREDLAAYLESVSKERT